MHLDICVRCVFPPRRFHIVFSLFKCVGCAFPSGRFYIVFSFRGDVRGVFSFVEAKRVQISQERITKVRFGACVRIQKEIVCCEEKTLDWYWDLWWITNCVRLLYQEQHLVNFSRYLSFVFGQGFLSLNNYNHNRFIIIVYIGSVFIHWGVDLLMY